MVRIFYDELLHNDPGARAKAQKLAPRVFELSEFIVDVMGISDLGPLASPTESEPLTTTYHEACHLRRELGVIEQPRALMRSLPGVELAEMDQAEVCCGFGGTFSVKFPDISGAMLQDKIDHIRDSGAQAVVACDSSCLMQIGGGLEKQGADVRPVHLARFIDERLSR